MNSRLMSTRVKASVQFVTGACRIWSHGLLIVFKAHSRTETIPDFPIRPVRSGQLSAWPDGAIPIAGCARRWHGLRRLRRRGRRGFDAQSGGEVAVGAAAHGGFAQFPSHLARYGSGLFVQSGHTGSAFHGRRLMPPLSSILHWRLKGADCASSYRFQRRLLCALCAHRLRLRFGWNHVGARSTSYDSDVDGRLFLDR